MPITDGGTYTPNSRIISPGTFVRENDLSGVAQGVSEIGGVIVAPFAKGPGFSPTVCNSVVELEEKFGTADGTLYGPYTAKNYVQEKGFVTVCRVGALTGYKQNYPWVMWAEYGDWLRNSDTGYLDPAYSTIPITDATFNTASAQNITFRTIGTNISSSGSTYMSTGVTGSIEFRNTPATLQFVSAPGTGLYNTASWTNISAAYSASNASVLSGSTYYAKVPVVASIYGSMSFRGYLNSGSYDLTTSSSILAAILDTRQFAGQLGKIAGSASFTSLQSPFNTDTHFYGDRSEFNEPITALPFLSQSVDSCLNPSLHILGLLSGSFGPYNGKFSGGKNTFDPCTGRWTTGAHAYKVLAVLGDTLNAAPNSLLQAPGFLGSTQSYNPTASGTTVGVDFNLELSQSSDGAYGVYNFSLDSTKQKYITNVFGHSPRIGDPATYAAGTKIEAAYLYKIFEDDIAVVASDPPHWRVNGTVMPFNSGSVSWTGDPLNFTDDWSLDLLNGDSQFGLTNAFTPWILSQKVAPYNGGPSHRFPLFRFATLSDGTYTNTSWKIEISNIKLAGTVAGSDWGTFTLSVRDYSDIDKKVKIIEQFNGLNLDPTSANFIARRIGDRYNYIRFDGKIIEFGTYNNLSKYIRAEMTENPYPTTSVPYGFNAYSVPVNGAIGKWCNPIAYTKASVYGLFPGKYPSGIDFNGAPNGADTELFSLYPSSSAGEEHWKDNLQYFAPVPSGASVGSNDIFALDDETTLNGVSLGSYISGSNAIPATYDAANETTYVKMRKFVFGFQGGFDGQSPAILEKLGGNMTPGNTQGLNCANSTTAGSIAYNQCIGALGNADEFDINLIVTPGIVYSLHSYVTNLVVEMCEKRGDCFYILDLYQDDGNPSAGQIDEVVNLAKEFDTSYAGTYYPWIKIKDTNINQIVTVPPSVVMPGIYAANDRVSAEWFAPAGLNRGGIPNAVQVTDRTTHTERDSLYEGRVNPIAAFPGQGIVVWGQKTLQVKPSALDRINVRRLMIEIKKYFSSVSRYIIFEQNVAATRNKFLSIVNPYLEGIQQRSGLYAFQVVMDDSNNTPDLVDRNILYGQIWLKTVKSAEFIILDFNILPTGAAFPTA